MTQPNSRDLPLNRVSFAVVRAIQGGDFVDKWRGLEKLNWPKGTIIRPIKPTRNSPRIEAEIIGLVESKAKLQTVRTKAGIVIQTLVDKIPSLSEPIGDVELMHVRTEKNNRNDKYITFRVRNEQIMQERHQIISVLGGFIGHDILWPDQRDDTGPYVEMNCAFLPNTAGSGQVKFVQGKIGHTMEHIQADLMIATLLPTS